MAGFRANQKNSNPWVFNISDQRTPHEYNSHRVTQNPYNWRSSMNEMNAMKHTNERSPAGCGSDRDTARRTVGVAGPIGPTVRRQNPCALRDM